MKQRKEDINHGSTFAWVIGGIIPVVGYIILCEVAITLILTFLNLSYTENVIATVLSGFEAWFVVCYKPLLLSACLIFGGEFLKRVPGRAAAESDALEESRESAARASKREADLQRLALTSEDHVFILSVAEAGLMTWGQRACLPGSWWLRTKGSGSSLRYGEDARIAYVDAFGRINRRGSIGRIVVYKRGTKQSRPGVRPAFYLPADAASAVSVAGITYSAIHSQGGYTLWLANKVVRRMAFRNDGGNDYKVSDIRRLLTGWYLREVRKAGYEPVRVFLGADGSMTIAPGRDAQEVTAEG